MARTYAEIEADGHYASYSRQSAGFTALRPARPIYQSTVTCSCGYKHRGQAGYTKRDAERDFRDHLRDMDLPTVELKSLAETEAVKRDEARAEAIARELEKRPDAARWLVTARIWVEHERGEEPSDAEVSQAVADRLGDGAYSINVERGRSFGGSRVIPTATEAELARRID